MIYQTQPNTPNAQNSGFKLN